MSAKYFTIAWTFIIIATFHFAATVEGLMPRTGWTQYGQMIGFVLEVVLLSFALAERINQERAALHAAQHEALRMTENIAREREEKVNAQTAMIRLQQQHNDELECRVNQRTKELEHAMNELATANRELSRMSFTDGLTQVANRHYFDRILKEELYRSCCDQTPLTLLLVDIDFFKKINDQWGHLAGDECLRQVAVALSAQTSLSRGLVARYGGEEFAVLLPGVDLDEGGLIAEQIRNQIECTEFQVKEDRVSLSVSIGIASQIAVEQENPEHLIGVADTALYQAKRAGRNRAVLAQAG